MTDEHEEFRCLQESHYLLSVLPELVWHRIIENLDDNNDLQSLINSSVFFRNLLHSKLIHIYFQDVIKIVTSQCISQNEAKSTVLNCRLVCQTWNKAIQDLAEDEQKWEIKHSRKTVYPTFQSIRTSYNFESTEKLENFLQEFEDRDTNINPFLGRSIKFSSHVYFYWSPFYSRNVIPLLEQYGNHIWSCTFHLRDLNQMLSEVIFKNVVKTLFLMPNLRKLRIEYENHLKFIPRAAITAPMLPKLEILEFSFVSTSFCDSIIAANNHVTKLVLAMSSAHLLYPFENLRELELYKCNMEEIDSLKCYDRLMWPLNKLTLRFDVEVDWAELLDFLSTKCGQTLKELELSTYHEETRKPEEEKIRRDCFTGRLNCPKLKKLKLCTANYSSFNFLLGSADSLEYIHIEWKLKKTKRQKKIFQFMALEMDSSDLQILDYRDKLYSSNIWKKFPKLKTVILEGYDMRSKNVYTRKGWKMREKSAV